MPATTLDTVANAFRTAIDATTPRMTEGQAVLPWRRYEGERAPSTSGRWYRLIWANERFTPLGFFGPVMCDKTVDLDIVVDYGGVPAHRATFLAGDDYQQVHDVLQRLKLTLPGFLNISTIDDGWDFLPGVDKNQAQIVLQYEVRYMRARA